jgi:hypothetical protein
MHTIYIFNFILKKFKKLFTFKPCVSISIHFHSWASLVWIFEISRIYIFLTLFFKKEL